MKKINVTLKVLLLICLMLSYSFLLASCSASGDVRENDNSTAMVVILGKHANAMEIPEDAYDHIENMLDNVVYGGYICAIISDSNPTKIELVEDKDFFIEDARNSTILEKRIKSRKAEIIKALKELTAVADSEEVDLLAAIREAENALSSNWGADVKNKVIVIVDTGISTTGDLNFCELDFLYNKPDVSEIVQQLKDYEGIGVLPDLTGVDIIFIGTADGLAEVAVPQEATTTDKKFIKDLWENVVTACSAKSVSFESAAGWNVPNKYTEDSVSKFKYVSVVPFYHKKVIDILEIPSYDPNTPDQQPILPKPPKVEIKLESQTVGFMPDKAVYINEQNAKSTLRPYADELEEFFKYFPEEKIWIVGTSAAVVKNDRSGYDLSLQRAEAVKSTLVSEFGIPADKLLTIGVGCVFPWRVDEFPNGNFDTTVAQANRAVFLLSNSDNTDYFQKLKAAYDNNELLPESISRFASIYDEG